MKKTMLTLIACMLMLAMLAGCGQSQSEQAANPSVEPTKAPTEAATETLTGTVPEETEDEYEGDASSYYIDVVYAEQIRRYHTAISQQWDVEAYMENEMSPLAASYYQGNPLDNAGFTFMDLDGDGIWELIIGAILNAEQDPLIFEIWGLKDDKPVMLAQSGSRNRYYLQYSQEENLWSVAYEAENGAANFAVYYLQLVNGEFDVIQGVVFDAMANEKNPWFMAYDLDWDVSNDTPIDEETADAVMEAGRKLYAATEYFPYCLYN
jgi:hypothetical protein